MSSIKNRVDMVQGRRIAKSLNQMAMDARIDKRSGAGNTKGDINDKHFKWELKTKEKPSQTITVHKEWYDKTERECYQNLTRNQIPGVIFGFGDGDDIVSMRFSFFEDVLKNHIAALALEEKCDEVCANCRREIECSQCPLRAFRSR